MTFQIERPGCARHEAGHGVVGAHEGIKITELEVYDTLLSGESAGAGTVGLVPGDVRCRLLPAEHAAVGRMSGH
jgi:hypothetical protein